jgi:hypothetical protein
MRAETLTGFHAAKGVVKAVRYQSRKLKFFVKFSNINFDGNPFSHFSNYHMPKDGWTYAWTDRVFNRNSTEIRTNEPNVLEIYVPPLHDTSFLTRCLIN